MTRGRKPLVSPTRSLHIHIDAELALTIDARLWSEAENKVPKSGYQQFFTEAAVRLLKQKPLDLSPFIGSIPTEHVVYAYPGTHDVLVETLKKQAPNAVPLPDVEVLAADTLTIIKEIGDADI